MSSSTGSAPWLISDTVKAVLAIMQIIFMAFVLSSKNANRVLGYGAMVTAVVLLIFSMGGREPVYLGWQFHLIATTTLMILLSNMGIYSAYLLVNASHASLRLKTTPPAISLRVLFAGVATTTGMILIGFLGIMTTKRTAWRSIMSFACAFVSAFVGLVACYFQHRLQRMLSASLRLSSQKKKQQEGKETRDKKESSCFRNSVQTQKNSAESNDNVRVWHCIVCRNTGSDVTVEARRRHTLVRLVRKLWMLLTLNAVTCSSLTIIFFFWGILSATDNRPYPEVAMEQATKYNVFSDVITFLAISLNGMMGYYSRAGHLGHAGMTRNTPKT